MGGKWPSPTFYETSFLFIILCKILIGFKDKIDSAVCLVEIDTQTLLAPIWTQAYNVNALLSIEVIQVPLKPLISLNTEITSRTQTTNRDLFAWNDCVKVHRTIPPIITCFQLWSVPVLWHVWYVEILKQNDIVLEVTFYNGIVKCRRSWRL